MAAPTKPELIDALTNANVVLTGGETVSELKALVEANAVVITPPEPAEVILKPGIIKEYTQNGFRYQRIRHEGGRIEDKRIG